LPLIDIAPALDLEALAHAWEGISRYRALMFVSAAAVEHFFAGAQDRSLVQARCWATGPGTAAALRKAGVPEALIDAPPADAAQFDSEALWARVQPQLTAGAAVLIVRGGDADGRRAGRDWLSAKVEAAGARCDQVVAYRRSLPRFDETQRALAVAASRAPSVWLFSSSEAIGNLCRAVPHVSWHEARAVATHPRIAQAASSAGFGRVAEARPVLDAVVASIESLR
jgi:uroporphyrinogen-III synthase